jgi:hypothetical protein
MMAAMVTDDDCDCDGDFDDSDDCHPLPSPYSPQLSLARSVLAIARNTKCAAAADKVVALENHFPLSFPVRFFYVC